MAQTAQTNRKKIMVPTTMSKSGWALIEARDDVEGVEFVPTIPKAEFHKVLEEASGICLGVQPFSDPELDAAPLLEVVSRIGVGYDAVDVPALTRRKVPLMIGGTSNSVSVAEAGVFLTMSLARKGASMDALVKRRPLARPLQGHAGRSLRQDRADRRLRQDRHALGEALRGDGDQRAGLRPVHLFRDDPRQRLRAGARSRRGRGARRFHHDPLPEDAGDDRPLQRRAPRAR